MGGGGGEESLKPIASGSHGSKGPGAIECSAWRLCFLFLTTFLLTASSSFGVKGGWGWGVGGGGENCTCSLTL